jgi:invasion protein IalB
MMIRAPVGLYLPAGIGVQIDEGKVDRLVIQTCDLKGCYAGTAISPELLSAMKAGSRFVVSFQNLARQDIAVPLTLARFTEAYRAIQ